MAGADVSPSPAVLQHDTKGNMTTDDRSCGMAWDFDNMLQGFAANGVTGLKNATYEYDAIARRVAKNVAETGGTQTTLFVLAGQQVVCEYTPTHPVANSDRSFTFGSYIDETLLFNDRVTGIPYYFHHNRQYSTYAVTDDTGLQREQYFYGSYGKHVAVSATGPLLGSETIGNHQQTFTGRLFDQESVTLYFRTRMYSPKSGSFLGRDIARFIDGANLSSGYFATGRLDPTGMYFVTAGLSGNIIPGRKDFCQKTFPVTGMGNDPDLMDCLFKAKDIKSLAKCVLLSPVGAGSSAAKVELMKFGCCNQNASKSPNGGDPCRQGRILGRKDPWPVNHRCYGDKPFKWPQKIGDPPCSDCCKFGSCLMALKDLTNMPGIQTIIEKINGDQFDYNGCITDCALVQ